MKVLGLDLSTQSCTGLLLDTTSGVLLWRSEVIYDHLPVTYGTRSGCIVSGPCVYCDPRLWLDALEELFQRLCSSGLTEDISAISGSAQQHGTVYLTSPFSLLTHQTLADWVTPVLSACQSPIWKDTSTTQECQEIVSALGGSDTVREITGSLLYERFPAPQIRKMYKQNRELYDATQYILPIAAFMTAILSDDCDFALDYAEGAATGLMNIHKNRWDERLLTATAPNLISKLPVLRPSGSEIGLLRSYFQHKYRLNPLCKSVLWSGDNPCSALGMGLTAPSTLGISLGSSDTVFYSSLDVPACSTVFRTLPGHYLPIIVVQNGASARVLIRDSLNLTWESFDLAAREPTSSLLPFFFSPEITPFLPTPHSHLPFPPDRSHCRALLDSQVLNLKVFTADFLPVIEEIRVTGGAAECTSLLQVVADVFRVPVYTGSTDEAALGAAVTANFSLTHDWSLASSHLHSRFTCKAQPNPELREHYQGKEREFKRFIQSIV